MGFEDGDGDDPNNECLCLWSEGIILIIMNL